MRVHHFYADFELSLLAPDDASVAGREEEKMDTTRSPWLIDLDGTLIDSMPVWDRYHRQITEELGGAAFRGVSWDLTDAAAQIDILVTLHLEVHGFTLQPGAAEFLERLNATRVPCALVTAGPYSVAKLFTDWLGTGLFLATVSADDVHFNKPAPDPYLQAAELLETDPASCIAVEDSPVGVRSALAAGVRTVIGVGPEHKELFKLGAVFGVSSLTDLTTLIGI